MSAGSRRREFGAMLVLLMMTGCGGSVGTVDALPLFDSGVVPMADARVALDGDADARGPDPDVEPDATSVSDGGEAGAENTSVDPVLECRRLGCRRCWREPGRGFAQVTAPAQEVAKLPRKSGVDRTDRTHLL